MQSTSEDMVLGIISHISQITTVKDFFVPDAEIFARGT